MESKTAQFLSHFFNCSNDDNTCNSRSSKKDPEPESIILGEMSGKTYAFIGLERIGGIMLYDITEPSGVKFVNYINSRNFAEDLVGSVASDIAPEGMYFISKEQSFSTSILLVAFEVSGTVAAYSVDRKPFVHNLTYIENN